MTLLLLDNTIVQTKRMLQLLTKHLLNMIHGSINNEMEVGMLKLIHCHLSQFCYSKVALNLVINSNCVAYSSFENKKIR